MIAFCKGDFPPPPPPAKESENDGGAIDDEDPSPPPSPKSPYPDTNLFNCATLTPNEKEDFKKLTCKTTAA